VEKGHQPFCPHLSHYCHIHYSCKRDYTSWWYDFDITFLDLWAEALFYIAPSAGADMEKARAEGRGLQIFTSLDQVPANEAGIPKISSGEPSLK
jgi:hypothetical protein